MKSREGQRKYADGDDDAERRNRDIADFEAKESGAEIDRDIARLKPPRRQHENGRDDEKGKPNCARSQDSHKFERVAMEAETGNQPTPKTRRGSEARADRFLDENDRHEQHASDRAGPKQLIGQEAGKGGVAGQHRDGDGEGHRPSGDAQEVEPIPLLGNLRAEAIVGAGRAPEPPQLDAEHDRRDHGGEPAHRDGDRQGGADNVVERREKTGDRDDAGKADRGANDACGYRIAELGQPPIGTCRSKQAACYSGRRGDADHRLARRLDERLQSRIGEIEGLQHEANDEDHRDRGNHDDKRDPPGPENFAKPAWIENRRMARKDAPGQPRERQTEQKEQGRDAPKSLCPLAIEPVVDAVDPFAEDRFYGGRVARRFVPDVDPERGVGDTRRPREQRPREQGAPPRRDGRTGLVRLDREQAGALQKFVGVVIELLLVGALRRHRRVFRRRGIVLFRTELVEARLDLGEARRQTVERTGYRVRNRIDPLTQGLEIRIGQIVTLEACFDLLERSAQFVEGRTDRRLLGRRGPRRSRRTRWLRRLALRWSLPLGRPLFLRGPLRLVLFLDRRLFRGRLKRGRHRNERNKTDQARKIF